MGGGGFNGVLSAEGGCKNAAVVGVCCTDDWPASRGTLDVVEGATDICSALEASVNECDELCALGFDDPGILFFCNLFGFFAPSAEGVLGLPAKKAASLLPLVGVSCPVGTVTLRAEGGISMASGRGDGWRGGTWTANSARGGFAGIVG